jgi:Kef-type K+ transport system membrane component KefB
MAALAVGAILLISGSIGGQATSLGPAETTADLAGSHAVPGGPGQDGAGHADLFTVVLLGLGLVVVVAMIGRWLAGLVTQPAVLGELLIGVLVGNVGYWLGLGSFALVMHLGDAIPVITKAFKENQSMQEAARGVFTPEEMAPGGRGDQVVHLLTGKDGPTHATLGFGLWMASNLGVILLLFLVGLESSAEEILRVGGRALLVAVLGVVAPFLLAYFTSLWLLPGGGVTTHLFLGATLCATSVGITARVFRDLRLLQSTEAKVILGATVIDDILGLIILAVVVGISATGRFEVGEIVRIAVLSAAFLGGLILLGEWLLRWIVPIATFLDRSHSKLLFPLALAFFLAWAASQIQLASIVGAFAAGLILNEQLFEGHMTHTTMEELVGPLEKLFAPVFFVLMGMQVNLASFLDLTILGLALTLLIVAVLGKLICGLPAGPGCDRLAVGVGMVPRGEVGLIFAGVGKGLGVMTDALFAALVLVLIGTTLVAPPALKWSLFRRRARLGRPEDAGKTPGGGE